MTRGHFLALLVHAALSVRNEEPPNKTFGGAIAPHAAEGSRRQAREWGGVSYEKGDMTTTEILDILEVREGSEFWTHVADGLAARVMKSLAAAEAAGASSLAESGMNVSSLVALRREELRGAASGGGARTGDGPGMQAAQALAGEHWLVQRAVRSALGVEPSAGGRAAGRARGGAVDLTCARNVQYHGAPPASEQARAEKMGDMLGEEAAGGMQTVLAKAWAKVTQDAGEAVALFTQFLRWEVQIAILGTGVPGIPTLAYKCQPLFTCIERIAKTPVLFLKLIGTFIEYLGTVFGELANGLIRQITGKAGDKASLAQQLQQQQQQQRQQQRQQGDPPTSALLELAMRIRNPGDDPVDKFVRQHHGPLFNDLDLASDECAPCAGRLKGLFDVDPLNLVTMVSTGGLVGVMKMWITSVPRPVAGAGASCLACLATYREQLTLLFTGSSGMSAKRYFESGKCNAHTLGLCLTLDKIRSCGSSIGEKGAVSVNLDKKAASAEADTKQKGFCDSLAGVQLSLVQVEGHVVCPEIHKEKLQEAGRAVEFGETTKMDMGEGCHLVRDALERYNRKCEAKSTAAEGGDWFAAIKTAIKNKAALARQKVGQYEYEKDQDPGSLGEAAKKCLALFGCPAPSPRGKGGDVDRARTRVNWEDLEDDIRAIVSQVDDYGGKPRSYSPTFASMQVARLLNSASGTMGRFEGDVSAKAAAARVSSTNRWAVDLRNVFALEHWDDKCFDFGKLKGPLKAKFAETPPKATKAEPKGRARSFFSQVAEVLKVWSWDARGSRKAQCEPLAWEAAGRSVTHPSPVAVREGPALTAIVDVDLDKLRAAFPRGGAAKAGAQVMIDCLGIPGDVELQLVRVGEGGAWYLQKCFLLGQCGGAVPGSRLRRMSLKVAAGGTAGPFRDAARTFVKTMEDTEESVVSRGEAGTRETDADMASFVAARELLKKARGMVAKEVNKKGYSASLIKGTVIQGLKGIVDKSAALQHFVWQRGWQFRERTAASEQRVLEGLPVTKQRCMATYGGKECDARWAKSAAGKTVDGSDKGFDLVGADGRELATLRQLDQYIRAFAMPHMDAFISMRDTIRTMGLALLKGVPAVEVWPSNAMGGTPKGFVVAEVELSFDALDESMKGLKPKDIKTIKGMAASLDEDLKEFDDYV